MKFSNVPVLLFLICYSSSLLTQVDRIPPTGLYRPGYSLVEWTDSSRTQFKSTRKMPRTLVVHIHYPAEQQKDVSSKGPTSVYLEKHLNSKSALQLDLHPSIINMPVVLFSPGRGTPGNQYTSLARELASHGYFVVTVDMPEIGMVVYSDGTTIHPTDSFRPPPGMMSGPYEKVDSFFIEPTDIGTQDLRFVLQKLNDKNDDDTFFEGRLNLNKIGIFGHSLGGRIGGNLAAIDKAVGAYISMEGIPPRDVRYEGKIPFPITMLCSSGTWPYARENYWSLIENSDAVVYMVELKDFGHNSVTDGPVLSPESYGYAVDPIEAIALIRQITLAYFDERLRDKKGFDEVLRSSEKIILHHRQ